MSGVSCRKGQRKPNRLGRHRVSMVARTVLPPGVRTLAHAEGSCLILFLTDDSVFSMMHRELPIMEWYFLLVLARTGRSHVFVSPML